MELLPGAEHVYTIDAQTGIVLGREARVDGDLCIRSALIDVAVDEALDDALFHPSELTEIENEAVVHLEMLQRTGVDTSHPDLADPESINAAFMEWMRTRNSQRHNLGTWDPPFPGPNPPE